MRGNSLIESDQFLFYDTWASACHMAIIVLIDINWKMIQSFNESSQRENSWLNFSISSLHDNVEWEHEIFKFIRLKHITLIHTFLALVRKLLWEAFLWGWKEGKNFHVISFWFMWHTSNNSKTEGGLTFTKRASEPPKANTQNQYYKFHNFPFSKKKIKKKIVI